MIHHLSSIRKAWVINSNAAEESEEFGSWEYTVFLVVK